MKEVEEACFSEERTLRRTREGLFSVLSRTDSGRYLLVVLAPQGGGIWKVVTARSMTDREKHAFGRAR